jgi:hypothetical protein
MTIDAGHWGTMHPSVFHHAAQPVRWAAATPRGLGALRYQCPVTGSLVLLTDEATLARLVRPRARVRCMDCGEMHLLTQDARGGDAAVIVTQPATP